MQDAVEITNVEKSFDPSGIAGIYLRPLRRLFRRSPVERVTALADLTLSIRRNEIFGIVGSNGSGKSTLARIVATLLIPDAGSVRVFAHDVVADPMSVRRFLNRVSVEASFFKKLSPMENLMFTARLYRVPPALGKQRIYEILGRLGIEKSAITRPMEQMSRGMQQKVAVARAFLTAPVFLVLDEPTTGLDPQSKRDVQRFIREVRASHDATVLLMSHDMEEVERLCDRVAVLDRGRIVARGPPDSLCQGDESLEDAFIRITGHEIDENPPTTTPGAPTVGAPQEDD